MLSQGMPTAMSPAKNSCSGLTLIEVLIALAIISIALTAIIKAASQTIRATDYLQRKTIALWVGREVMQEVRANIIKLPGAGESISQSRNMLDKTWYWQMDEADTANDQIKKITVNVYDHEPDADTTSIVTLETYVADNANQT
jgi:general secretion pathway protein I